jgi:hypothetical protein
VPHAEQSAFLATPGVNKRGRGAYTREKMRPNKKTDAKIKLDAGDGIFSLAAAKRGEYIYIYACA